MEEDIDLEVTYCLRSDIAEAPQEISETQEKSVKPTQSYFSKWSTDLSDSRDPRIRWYPSNFRITNWCYCNWWRSSLEYYFIDDIVIFVLVISLFKRICKNAPFYVHRFSHSIVARWLRELRYPIFTLICPPITRIKAGIPVKVI